MIQQWVHVILFGLDHTCQAASGCVEDWLTLRILACHQANVGGIRFAVWFMSSEPLQREGPVYGSWSPWRILDSGGMGRKCVGRACSSGAGRFMLVQTPFRVAILYIVSNTAVHLPSRCSPTCVQLCLAPRRLSSPFPSPALYPSSSVYTC